MADLLTYLTLGFAVLLPVIPFLPRAWLERVFGLGSVTSGVLASSNDQPKGGA